MTTAATFIQLGISIKEGVGVGMRAKIESSEVLSGPFVSASSSRLTLARPALALSLAGVQRAIFAWAPGSPPTGKTYPTPRNSILPLTWLLVLLDQRFAIDPYRPSFSHLAMQKVTSA